MFYRGNIAIIAPGRWFSRGNIEISPLFFMISVWGALGTILVLFWVPAGVSLGASGAPWKLFEHPQELLGVTLGALGWSFGPLGGYLGALWHLIW